MILLLGKLDYDLLPRHSQLSQDISSTRTLVTHMRSTLGSSDDINYVNILAARSSTLDDLESRWECVLSRAEGLRSDLLNLEQSSG